MANAGGKCCRGVVAVNVDARMTNFLLSPFRKIDMSKESFLTPSYLISIWNLCSTFLSPHTHILNVSPLQSLSVSHLKEARRRKR